MIDMDDLIGDDDFFEPMTVYRRPITYDGNGQPQWTATLISPSPFGSIQSGANPDLVRLKDFAATENMITVYTSFALRSEGDTTGYTQPPEGEATTDAYGNQILPDGASQSKADIVMFHGDPFEVFLVQDWTDYGAGFIAAIARQVSSAAAAL